MKKKRVGESGSAVKGRERGVLAGGENRKNFLQEDQKW